MSSIAASASAAGLVYSSISQRDPHRSVEIRHYQRDTIIHRKYVNTQSRSSGSCRSVVSQFSRKSRNRLSFVARNAATPLPVFITLTYPSEYPSDGSTVKRHLNAFLQFVRRRNLSFLWFLEFQRRGAPHFHIAVSGYVSAQSVALAWFRIVGSGDPAHFRAGTRCEHFRDPRGFAAYATKYALKFEQKTVPAGYENVGRFWGASRSVNPEPSSIINGSPHQLAPVIRQIVRFYNALRAGWHKPPIVDNGRYSLKIWDSDMLTA